MLSFSVVCFGTPTPLGAAPGVGTFPVPGWPEPHVSVVLTPSCQVVSARAVWPEARGSHRGFPQHTPAPDGGLCCSHGHSSGPRERTATGCHVLCQSRCKRYASRAGAPSGLPWVFVAGVPGTAPAPLDGQPLLWLEACSGSAEHNSRGLPFPCLESGVFP